jgi:hypothetical protein
MNTNKPFTVGQMKKAIEGLSDDTQILVAGTEGCAFDWANLHSDYDHPDAESGFMALSFYLNNNYDPRQF